MGHKTTTPVRRPELQGIRAIAVIAVVLYHAKCLSSGFMGVDIFFVLSGYVITGNLLRTTQHSASLVLYVIQFYSTRLRRLLPASVFVLWITTSTMAPLLNRISRFQLITDAKHAIVFMFNERQWTLDNGYFVEQLLPSAFLHYWSLCVEEQFYFGFPLLFWFLAKASQHTRLLVLVTLCILSIVSAQLALTSSQWTNGPSWAFYTIVPRSWQLLSGCIVAMVPDKFHMPGAVQSVCAVLGFAGMLLCCVVYRPTAFPGVYALPPTMSMCLFLLCRNPAQLRVCEIILCNRVMVYIGDLSYSIYLWHWPCLYYFCFDEESQELVFTMNNVLLGLLFTTVLSVASYHLLENPIRHSVVLSKCNWIVLGASVVVIVTSYFTLDSQQPRSWPVVSDIPFPPVNYTEYPTYLEDRMQDVIPAVLSSECATPWGGYGIIDNGGDNVLLVGDSHAEVLYPSLFSALDERGGVVIHGPGCAGLWDIGLPYTAKCSLMQAQVRTFISTRRPKLVIFHHRWTFPTWDYSPIGNWTLTATMGFQSMFDFLHLNGVRAMVIGGNPECGIHNLKCLTTPRFAGVAPVSRCSCTRETAVRSEWTSLVQSVTSRNNVSFVDVSDLFCGPMSCPALSDSLPLLQDTNHVCGDYWFHVRFFLRIKLCKHIIC